jgi:TPR repeat protein
MWRWVSTGVFVIAAAVHAAHWIKQSGPSFTGADFDPSSIGAALASLKARCAVEATCPVSKSFYNAIAAAVAGDHNGEIVLAVDLLDARDGAPKDDRVGAIWLARAAEGGQTFAQDEVARRRREGLIVETDDTKLAANLLVLANKGDLAATRLLAPMYFSGHGVARDPSEGMRLLKAAAEAGDDKSAEDLINIYAHQGAPGVSVDRNEEVRWVEFLARKGRTDMMQLAGRLMLNLAFMMPPAMFMMPGTPGLTPDFRPLDGYRWLIRGAMMNDGGSQNELGHLFIDGVRHDGEQIIQPDAVAADTWLRLASQDPTYSDGRDRSRLEEHMTTAEINDARARAAAFKPTSFEAAMAMTIKLPP